MLKNVSQAVKYLLWFAGGQAVQLVCHAVAQNLWDYRRIPFCCAAGFLVCVAVWAGTCIREKPAQPKTYLDYAEEAGYMEEAEAHEFKE